MANPYYVAPLGGYDPAQGIREVFQGFQAGAQKRQAKRDRQKSEELFANEQSKKNLGDMAIRYFAGEDPKSLIAERADFVLKQGGDPSDTLALADAAPEVFEKRMKGALMALRPDMHRELFPKDLERFEMWKAMPDGPEKSAFARMHGFGESSSQANVPSSVRETQWFMGQPKNIQDQHLKLKRKTDPTMSQILERKQKESDIKVDEAKKTTEVKGNAQRSQGYIDSGVEAADSLGNINRVMGLLESVDTGGFSNVALRAKQMFGIESADEAQLSAGLGKAILAQLKPIFGSAFTAAEGERLERIEANFGKSTEGNKRLLAEVKKMTERAARRGLRAAEKVGDEFTAQEIRNSLEAIQSMPYVMDSTEQQEKEIPNVNSAGWQLMTDANGNKAYVSHDGTQFEEVK